MLLTDKFVFVHIPKTGGTFVTRAVKTALCPGILGQRLHTVRKRYRLRIPFYHYRYDEMRKHAMCKHIPADHADKPILSCVRNPFDLYVSQYKFMWWRKNPHDWFADVEAVVQNHGPLAEMSFASFVDATQDFGTWMTDCRARYPRAQSLGWYSTEWIHYFCKDPAWVIDAADDAEALVARARESMYPVRFLNTGDLNGELHQFLLNLGYEPERIDFITSLGKITPGRPTRSEEETWERFYSNALKAKVRERERLLFRLFPVLESAPV